MDRPHVRPRVALWIPTPPSDLLATLEARLRASDRLEGRVRPQAVLIWMGPARRRWWSPCLDLTPEAHPQGTRLVGYYSAHPQWMTFLVFASILLLFLTALSGCWSMVQLQLGETPRCLWGTAAAVGALTGMAGVHAVGKRWAAAQMHELASLLDGLGAVEVDEAHAFDGAPPR